MERDSDAILLSDIWKALAVERSNPVVGVEIEDRINPARLILDATGVVVALDGSLVERTRELPGVVVADNDSGVLIAPRTNGLAVEPTNICQGLL